MVFVHYGARIPRGGAIFTERAGSNISSWRLPPYLGKSCPIFFFPEDFLFWQVYGQRVVNTMATETALFYSNSALAFCFMTPAISKAIALCFS